MAKGQQSRFRFANLGVTQGALVVFLLELGMSLVYLMLPGDPGGPRAQMAAYTIATPAAVFEHARVWTLVTSPLLEIGLLGLIMHGFVLFMFVPTLERFWGTARFYRFVIITSLVGSVAAVVTGQLLGHPDVYVSGLNPFMYASIVAFGITYARQPVQFFGVLPLTGRQLMWGFIVFLTFFTVLQGVWEAGAAFAAAMGTAALMTSKFSPGLAWKRWRIKRARAQLSVIQGGAGAPKSDRPKRGSDDQKYLN